MSTTADAIFFSGNHVGLFSCNLFEVVDYYNICFSICFFLFILVVATIEILYKFLALLISIFC